LQAGNGWLIYEPGNSKQAASLGSDFQPLNHHLEFSPDGSHLANADRKGLDIGGDLPTVG
jgi:hypothetical protein